MRRTITALAAMALVLGACGAGEAGDTATTAGPPGTTTAPPTTTTQPDAATVQVAPSSLGEILVDADGRSLYLFMPDAQGESTCYDACESNWPPLTVEGIAGDGVEAALLGTTERTDGSVQVTYNGWPLYHFGGDAAAGDTNGQGLNDVWFVVSPTGEAIE